MIYYNGVNWRLTTEAKWVLWIIGIPIFLLIFGPLLFNLIFLYLGFVGFLFNQLSQQ